MRIKDVNDTKERVVQKSHYDIVLARPLAVDFVSTKRCIQTTNSHVYTCLGALVTSLLLDSNILICDLRS
jgi:hypothetical protein